MNAICKKWFINECTAYLKETLDLTADTENTPTSTISLTTLTEIVRSSKSKEQVAELAFVEKLFELWR